MLELYSHTEEYKRVMEDINQNGWKYANKYEKPERKPLKCHIPYLKQTAKCQCV